MGSVETDPPPKCLMFMKDIFSQLEFLSCLVLDLPGPEVTAEGEVSCCVANLTVRGEPGRGPGRPDPLARQVEDLVIHT